MRKHYINVANLKYCNKSSAHTMHINDIMNGYISLIKIIDVKDKFIAEYNGKKTVLCDNNYKNIRFLPDNEFWCVEAIYDNNSNIVEWYFDITNGNYIDENNNPYFDDLYLDVVLMPDGEVIIFDENELLDAYEENKITSEQLIKAKDTANKIINEIIPNKQFINDFFNKYFEKFDIYD